MKKISTLYKKDPNDLGRVVNKLDPENSWVLEENALATQKFDGTACAIINGEIYKRYDAKKGKMAPEGSIPCQEADPISGHHPHWVKCERNNKGDQYFFEGLDNLEVIEDGTYELCGPKVQNNREKLTKHQLLKHGNKIVVIADLSFEGLKQFLYDPKNDMEGIVFHHNNDGRMCKIRKRDFGVKRA